MHLKAEKDEYKYIHGYRRTRFSNLAEHNRHQTKRERDKSRQTGATDPWGHK